MLPQNLRRKSFELFFILQTGKKVCWKGHMQVLWPITSKSSGRLFYMMRFETIRSQGMLNIWEIFATNLFFIQIYYKHVNRSHQSVVSDNWHQCDFCKLYYPSPEILDKHKKQRHNPGLCFGIKVFSVINETNTFIFRASNSLGQFSSGPS